MDLDELLENLDKCFYCGNIADSTDHVVPKSMLQTLSILEDKEVTNILVRFNRRLTVPSCKQCNSMLSNKYFDTLRARKAYLKTRLRKKYSSLLRTADWTSEQLQVLDGNMRKRVEQSLREKTEILKRLSY